MWRIYLIVLGIVGVCCSGFSAEVADRAVKANMALSGNWQGSARVTTYQDRGQLHSGEREIRTEKVQLSLVFNQLDQDLAASMTVVTAEEVLTWSFAGRAGNRHFWLSGGGLDEESNPHSFVLSGHQNTKNTKILGTGIGWVGSETFEFSFSLTRSGPALQAAAPLVAAGPHDTGDSRSDSSYDDDDDDPFPFKGTAKGKSFPLTAGHKPKPFSGTVSGVAFNELVELAIQEKLANNSYVLTSAHSSDHEVLEGFDATGTKRMVLSLHGNDKGGRGMGYLLSLDGVTEFKFNVKHAP